MHTGFWFSLLPPDADAHPLSLRAVCRQLRHIPVGGLFGGFCFSFYPQNHSRCLSEHVSPLAGAPLGQCLQLRAAGLWWALHGGVGWAVSQAAGSPTSSPRSPRKTTWRGAKDFSSCHINSLWTFKMSLGHFTLHFH